MQRSSSANPLSLLTKNNVNYPGWLDRMCLNWPWYLRCKTCSDCRYLSLGSKCRWGFLFTLPHCLPVTLWPELYLYPRTPAGQAFRIAANQVESIMQPLALRESGELVSCLEACSTRMARNVLWKNCLSLPTSERIEAIPWMSPFRPVDKVVRHTELAKKRWSASL